MADQDVATLVSATTAANSQTNVIFTGISDGTDLALVDGSGNLNVILASNTGVDIGDVDVTSVIPGTGATNAGKAVDSVAGATDTGTALLAVRDDVLTTLTPVDGDYVRLRVDSTGALHTTASITINAEQLDDAAFTPAVSTVNMSGYFVDETATDLLDEGDGGAARIDTSRRQLVRIVGATDANRAGVDGSGNLTAILAANSGVDVGDVTINNASGASAVNIQDGGNSITVDNATLSVVGGGVEATALRVTIASDSTGLLSIDDNGGSLTVDQPTHANLQANVTLQINDVDVSATVPVPISATAAANSELNPIFTKSVDTVVSASEVHDFNTATVAASSTSNHDYTITGTTGFLKQVHYASSGPLKVEIQTGPLATLVTIGVRFLPRAGGGDVFDISSTPREVPVTSTGTIRAIRTNRDPGVSIDVYTTIVLNDV